MTVKYREIIDAKKLLNLPERASMEEIKTIYRNMLKKWHPDKSEANDEKCNEMTRKIVSAYKVIMAYCEQYQYAFTDEEFERYLSIEDWWFDRFGKDPLWGKHKKS